MDSIAISALPSRKGASEAASITSRVGDSMSNKFLILRELRLHLIPITDSLYLDVIDTKEGTSLLSTRSRPSVVGAFLREYAKDHPSN